jgi:hypothetical protein
VVEHQNGEHSINDVALFVLSLRKSISGAAKSGMMYQ